MAPGRSGYRGVNPRPLSSFGVPTAPSSLFLGPPEIGQRKRTPKGGEETRGEVEETRGEVEDGGFSGGFQNVGLLV